MLGVFILSAIGNLASLVADAGWLEVVTKAMLMPSLAGWAWARGGPRLVVAALLLSAAGDITLGVDGLFIVGMGFFGAAHLCYVTFFVRSGAGAAPRRRWLIVAAYSLLLIVLVVVLWPGLGALRLPVAGYSLLLTATAATSAGYGLRTGIGGALFLISDSLIALGLADLPRPPQPGLWVMSTYIVAQYLLASGVVASPTPAAEHNPRPRENSRIAG